MQQYFLPLCMGMQYPRECKPMDSTWVELLEAQAQPVVSSPSSSFAQPSHGCFFRKISTHFYCPECAEQSWVCPLLGFLRPKNRCGHTHVLGFLLEMFSSQGSACLCKGPLQQSPQATHQIHLLSFITPSPKWVAVIKPVPLSLKDLCGRGGRKAMRARSDGWVPGKTVSSGHNRTDAPWTHRAYGSMYQACAGSSQMGLQY